MLMTGYDAAGGVLETLKSGRWSPAKLFKEASAIDMHLWPVMQDAWCRWKGEKLFWAKPVRTRGGIERSLLFNTESDSFYLLIYSILFLTRFLSWFLLSIKCWAWLLDICINYRKTGTFLVCLGELVHCNMVGNHMVPQTQWNTGLHWSRHTSNTRTCSCNSTGLVQLNYFSGVLVLAYNTTCCKRTLCTALHSNVAC